MFRFRELQVEEKCRQIKHGQLEVGNGGDPRDRFRVDRMQGEQSGRDERHALSAEPPQNQKDIPAAYLAQVKAYGDIVARIYPGRAVRGFLLWTDGPILMELKP